MNWTEPPGVPTPSAAATVAVNVTAWPKTEGFGETLNDVVVAALLGALAYTTLEVKELLAASPQEKARSWRR